MIKKVPTQKRKTWIVLVFILFFSACSSQTPNEESTKQTVEPVTKTSVPQITPTTPFVFDFDSSCWPIRPLQPGNNIPGSLLMGRDPSGGYYWDISTFQAKELSNNNWMDPIVAFGGEFLISLSNEAGNFTRLTLTGSDRVITVDLPRDNYRISNLSKGRILLASQSNRSYESNNYQSGVGFTDVYYIFDPATNALTFHSIFLPNIAPWREESFFIFYSPDGRYVLYRSQMPEPPSEFGYALMDILSKEILWTLPDIRTLTLAVGNADVPNWKPDSQSLLYYYVSGKGKTDQNLYEISLDGTRTQFTRLESVLKQGYRIGSDVEWAPNMEYVAFHIESPSEDPQLYIWDDHTKTLLKPCLPLMNVANLKDVISPTFGWGWSFDGNYLLITLSYQGTPTPDGILSYTHRRLILDLPNKIIWEMPDDHTMQAYLKTSDKSCSYGPFGWINWEIP
ncbi:MAG: hypothetical protein HYZ25_15735 [Chloroflexi bacterium]|nr:hypothetical protein [Chloroflexota bacterium]